MFSSVAKEIVSYVIPESARRVKCELRRFGRGRSQSSLRPRWGMNMFRRCVAFISRSRRAKRFEDLDHTGCQCWNSSFHFLGKSVSSRSSPQISGSAVMGNCSRWRRKRCVVSNISLHCATFFPFDISTSIIPCRFTGRSPADISLWIWPLTSEFSFNSLGIKSPDQFNLGAGVSQSSRLSMYLMSSSAHFSWTSSYIIEGARTFVVENIPRW